MKARIKARWVEKLRSDEFQQGQGYLRDCGDNYCCLGVLCEIAVEEGVIAAPTISKDGGDCYTYWGESTGSWAQLPPEVKAWAQFDDDYVLFGLGGGIDATLVTINDDLKYTFDQIADLIENQLPVSDEDQPEGIGLTPADGGNG